MSKTGKKLMRPWLVLCVTLFLAGPAVRAQETTVEPPKLGQPPDFLMDDLGTFIPASRTIRNWGLDRIQIVVRWLLDPPPELALPAAWKLVK